MPVLEINEDERVVLDVALMEHRRNLMKEWEKIRGKGRWNPVSRNQECDWLDDKIVLAGLLRDRLAKLTAGGDETQITEADNAVSKGIWALITRNFSAVSEREIQLAEKVMRSDPSVLRRIRSSVEDLQKAYADDGKFLVNIEVDGKTAEVKVDGRFLKVLNDLNRRF